MTKKNPLSTEARISLRHLRKQLNQDALDAARVFGQTEKMSSETMNVLGKSLLDLPPPRRVEKLRGWMHALDQIPSFCAGRMGQTSSRQLNAALIGPWPGVSGHLMQGTAALLPSDIGLQRFTIYTNRKTLGVNGAQPMAVVGEHAMGRAFERAGLTVDEARGVLRAIGDAGERFAKHAGTRHEGRHIAALIGHGLVAVGVLRSYYSQATFRCDDRTQEAEVRGVCIDIRTVLTEDMPNAAVAFAKAIQPIMDMIDADAIRAFMDGIDPLERAPSDYASQILAEEAEDDDELADAA